MNTKEKKDLLELISDAPLSEDEKKSLVSFLEQESNSIDCVDKVTTKLTSKVAESFNVMFSESNETYSELEELYKRVDREYQTKREDLYDALEANLKMISLTSDNEQKLIENAQEDFDASLSALMDEHEENIKRVSIGKIKEGMV